MSMALSRWLTAAVLTSCLSIVTAQPLAYRLADPADAAKPDYVKAAATLPSGDVAVALIHSDSIAVDDREAILNGRGSKAGVVVYDRNTGAATTRFSFGGEALRVVPHGLEVDRDGAFVVIGYAGGNGSSRVDLGAGPISFTAAEVPFVARFDAAGKLLWGHVLQGREGSQPRGCAGRNCDRAWDVALAPDGRVAVVGGFSGRLAWPGGELISRGDTDLFVLLFNRDGAAQAGWTVGGPAAEGGRQGFVASPGGLGETAIAWMDGGVVLQGTFGPEAEFGGLGPSFRRSPTSGVRDVFIARYSPQGRLMGTVWTADVPRDTPGSFAAPGALRVDAQGHIFLSLRIPTGGPAWPGCPGLSGATDRIVTASFELTERTGLRCRWLSAFDFSAGGVHRTVPDGRGQVYVAGWFGGSHAFPNQRLAARSSRSDVFLAQLNADTGRVTWGAGLISTDIAAANNIPAGLAIDGTGHPWIGGQFFSAIETAQSGQPSKVLKPVFSGTPVGNSGDAFVVRLDAGTGKLR